MANLRKAKGTRAEAEFAKIASEKYGVPACRVIGSGAVMNVGGDNKLGVQITEDGTTGGKDDAECLFRVEMKNRKATNLDWTFELLGTDRTVAKGVTDALLQNKMANVLVMRRQKAPSGSLKNQDANQLFVAAMLGGDFLEFVREHLHLLEENSRLRTALAKKMMEDLGC